MSNVMERTYLGCAFLVVLPSHPAAPIAIRFASRTRPALVDLMRGFSHIGWSQFFAACFSIT
jgi:hypothetical protein